MFSVAEIKIKKFDKEINGKTIYVVPAFKFLLKANSME